VPDGGHSLAADSLIIDHENGVVCDLASIDSLLPRSAG
jgi:hypothetical protein